MSSPGVYCLISEPQVAAGAQRKEVSTGQGEGGRPLVPTHHNLLGGVAQQGPGDLICAWVLVFVFVPAVFLPFISSESNHTPSQLGPSFLCTVGSDRNVCSVTDRAPSWRLEGEAFGPVVRTVNPSYIWNYVNAFLFLTKGVWVWLGEMFTSVYLSKVFLSVKPSGMGSMYTAVQTELFKTWNICAQL